MWLWATYTFLVVISCIRLPKNNQANVNTNQFLIFCIFTRRQYLYWLFLLSSIIQIFQSLLIIALIMTNTMTCAMKPEAWSWYLPSHLVPAKTLCSRWEPCTKLYHNTRGILAILITKNTNSKLMNYILIIK